jgi:hypothetical protein
MSLIGIPDRVYTSHEQLQDWSHQARYLLRRFPIKFYEDKVLSHLETVTSYVGLT